MSLAQRLAEARRERNREGLYPDCEVDCRGILEFTSFCPVCVWKEERKQGGFTMMGRVAFVEAILALRNRPDVEYGLAGAHTDARVTGSSLQVFVCDGEVFDDYWGSVDLVVGENQVEVVGLENHWEFFQDWVVGEVLTTGLAYSRILREVSRITQPA